LETLTETDDFIDFASLYDLLRGRGMIPVGVRNGSAKLQAAAVQAGLPVLPDNRSPVVAKKVDRPSGQRSKIVTQPVRSGQQLYAPDGDLILMGAVSPGAEVLADGSIHIYGTLRGRALAGAKGDTEARIFCQNLEAELVAIAGHYRVFEQLAPDTRGKAVQVYLLEDRLIIEPLSR
jgi:septum site-determining protein MinC